jgi:spore germination protein KB
MKITSYQLFWIIASLEIGMVLLLTQSPAIEEAKQDAWISFILAGAAGMGITFVAGKLSLLYPNQTFIQYSQTILGKWLGRMIVVPYFIHWLTVIGIIFRQSSGIIQMTLFTQTPLFILIILLLLLVIYVNYLGGIEGIARCSEIMGPFIFLMVIITLLLNFNNIEWDKILPVYSDSGFKSILQGSLTPVSFYGESVLIMMLIYFTEEPNKGVRGALWGVGIVGFLVIISTIEILMVFGPNLASRIWYPYFEMARYISLMQFLQNLEIVVTVIWIFSVFIKLSVYLFISSYGIAQLLNIKDWRKVIWIVAIISLVLSMIYPNNNVAAIDYIEKYWIPYVLPINMIGIPLFLWCLGVIRKKKGN